MLEMCFSNLKFPEFTTLFKKKASKEVPLLLATYAKNFNFENIRGVEEWKRNKEAARLRKQSHEGINDVDVGLESNTNEEFRDWKLDPIERARRIGIWWEEHYSCFKYLNKAMGLISLIQTSSCFVERAFSQLKIIVDTCGTQMLEDQIELRMYHRMNNALLTEMGIL